MIEQQQDALAGTSAATFHGVRESAQRALFSAASRVLRYHAAALDARVARIGQSEASVPDERDTAFVRPAGRRRELA
jgi:hypothetical protein